MERIEDVIRREWESDSNTDEQVVFRIGELIADPQCTPRSRKALLKLLDEVLGIPSEPVEMTDSERQAVKDHYNVD